MLTPAFAMQADGDEKTPKLEAPLGLTVSKTGSLLLKGKPYRGVGVNYFNAFARTLQPQAADDTSYRQGFRYLALREIPFIRFMAGGFWPGDWKLYLQDKGRYFRNFDAFVASAEANNIGLIPSLFWHYSTIPDLVNEPVNQWGNPSSKTVAFMREYVQQVVSRYKDSPSIWAWEFGNEYNLVADLPGDNDNLPPITVANGTPATRSKADKLSTADIRSALHEFAREVRKHDASRMIISGNSIPRPSAFHLYQSGSWTKDTEKEFGQMLNLHNPTPVNGYSIHHYPENAFQYFQDQKASLAALIRVTMDHAVAAKRPLFIGEFGSPELTLGTQPARSAYYEILNGIERYKVPLSAVWVFDYAPHDIEGGINIGMDNGPRQYMLEAIRELNNRMMR